MAKNLRKLGLWAFVHPWRTLALWLVTLVVLGGLAGHFMQPLSSTVSIPGTQAQQGLDRLGDLFPAAGEGSGRIVFAVSADKKVADYKPQIEAFVAKVAKVEGVSQVVSPFLDASFVSQSGNIAYSQVQLKEPRDQISDTTRRAIATLVTGAGKDGLRVEMGGDLIGQPEVEVLGPGELGGVLLALVVLVLTLGSLVAAGMPLVTALIAVGVSIAGLFSLSKLVEIGSTTPVLAVMLGLAVGIDYSLFIINKYRTYVLEGMGYKEAAARAVGTAGNAVVFAAFTVIIALSALSIVQIPFMTTMGLAGAASIAVAALAAITVVPALLRFAGGKIFSARQRAELADTKRRSELPRNTVWYRWGDFVTSHPRRVLAVALVVVVAIAIPAKSLNLGLPTDQYAAPEATERKAYDLLSEGFGVGFNAPLTVIAEGLPAVSDADRQTVRQQAMAELESRATAAKAQQQAAFQQQAAAAKTPAQQKALQQQIAQAQAEGQKQQQQAMVQVEANVENYAKLVQLSKVGERLAKQPDVQKVLPALATSDGTAGILQVIPKTAPSDQATYDLIEDLRSKDLQASLSSNDSVRLEVTGSAALERDINKKLAAALPQYLLVVVGLSLVLLIIAFRSILVPVKATLGFLLSVLAMFGTLVVVFQWGWLGIVDASGPIVSFIPIIAIGVLFGLAMDYEFFLVSSMHEAYTASGKAKEAVVKGFAAGSKVVTAAGVIMVSVFAGFITNHDTVIQSVGFALAIGILVDAFIVRMTIVPAVMVLLGKSAWWLPKWLQKYLPHVSIDGEPSKR